MVEVSGKAIIFLLGGILTVSLFLGKEEEPETDQISIDEGAHTFTAGCPQCILEMGMYVKEIIQQCTRFPDNTFYDGKPIFDEGERGPGAEQLFYDVWRILGFSHLEAEERALKGEIPWLHAHNPI